MRNLAFGCFLSTNRYTNRENASKLNHEAILKECRRCKKPFDPTGRPSKKFCTEACRMAMHQELRLFQSMDQKRRWAILQRDNFTCTYCGRKPGVNDVWLTIDHVIPKSKGGTNVPENLVTACSECNRGKSDSNL